MTGIRPIKSWSGFLASRRILCCGQPLGIMARQIHLGRIGELIEAVMKALKDIRTYLLVCTLVVILQPLSGLAQQNSNPSKPKLQPSPTPWDRAPQDRKD